MSLCLWQALYHYSIGEGPLKGLCDGALEGLGLHEGKGLELAG